MAEHVWRPARKSWVDAEGVVWTRCGPRWLAERNARRLMFRPSTLVAVEESPSFALTWLDPAVRERYWATHVAGHVDARTGHGVPENSDGLTYGASMWTNDAGQRLILLSEEC